MSASISSETVIRDIIRGRHVPADCVAPSSEMATILGRRALSSGRGGPRRMPRITVPGHQPARGLGHRVPIFPPMTKPFLVLCTALLLALDTTTIRGQADPPLLANLSWRSIGPAGAAGRIVDIAVVGDFPHRIYIAA